MLTMARSDDSPLRPTAVKPPHAATSTQVLRKFRIVFNAVRTHFQQMEKQSGLGGAQIWALSLVRDDPGIGTGEIARRMDIHQSTASNLIKTLQGKGLIQATKDTVDRRAVRLHILPEGLTVLGHLAGPLEGVLPMALGQLPADTLRRLDQDLGELIELLNADKRAGKNPLAEL